MTIVDANFWWNDTAGRRHRDTIPANALNPTLEAISRYWSDPYTNLGTWKPVNRAKSHPGVYDRHYAAPGLQSDADL